MTLGPPLTRFPLKYFRHESDHPDSFLGQIVKLKHGSIPRNCDGDYPDKEEMMKAFSAMELDLCMVRLGCYSRLYAEDVKQSFEKTGGTKPIEELDECPCYQVWRCQLHFFRAMSVTEDALKQVSPTAQGVYHQMRFSFLRVEIRVVMLQKEANIITY